MAKTLQLTLKLRQTFFGGTQRQKEVKINFSNQTEFTLQLIKALHEKECAYEVSLKFDAKEKLPSYVASVLLREANPEFLETSLIVRVQGPQDLFDADQAEELRKLICLNKEKFSNQAQKNVVAGAVLIVGFVATGNGLFGLLASATVACVSWLKGEYNKRCSTVYEEKIADKTENTKLFQSSDEKAAFMDGVRAKDWSGYLTSFTYFRNYTNPFAFAAGMRFGIQENEVVIDAAKRAKI